jgi:hypothetical protein
MMYMAEEGAQQHAGDPKSLTHRLRHYAKQARPRLRRYAPPAGVGLALILFAISAYVFNWAWTGFPGNTLWDWMQLLLVPAALNAATIAYTTDHLVLSVTGPWSKPWVGKRDLRHLATGAVLLAFLFVLLAYVFHWRWTGFMGEPPSDSTQPKTVWDWLNMLLLPVAVAAATVRFTAHHRRGGGPPTTKS